MSVQTTLYNDEETVLVRPLGFWRSARLDTVTAITDECSVSYNVQVG